MKKLLLFTLLIVGIISEASCSKDDETNTFQGNWSGTVSGDINGTWSGIVTSKGYFVGNVIVNPADSDDNFVLTGNVSNEGILNASMINGSTGMEITYTGIFQNVSCSGTWVLNGALLNGTWIGIKN